MNDEHTEHAMSSNEPTTAAARRDASGAAPEKPGAESSPHPETTPKTPQPRTPRKPRKPRGKLTPLVTETLAASLERGDSLEGAAAAAGVSRSTLTTWLRRGAKAFETGEQCLLSLESEDAANAPGDAPEEARRRAAYADEARYVELFMRVRQALARAETRNLQVIEEAGRGGARITEVVRVVDKDGALVKETTTTKQAPPQWKAAAWRLERLYPHKYGGKEPKQGRAAGVSLKVEVVADPGPGSAVSRGGVAVGQDESEGAGDMTRDAGETRHE